MVLRRQDGPSSHMPLPGNGDAVGCTERSLHTTRTVPSNSEKKSPHDECDQGDHTSSDSSDIESIEDDEEDWQLDDALQPVDSKGLPTYEESEAIGDNESVDDMVRDTLFASHVNQATTRAVPQIHGHLSVPVVIPQRRPYRPSRGFVRAYAPVLADCGIDQTTFLTFLRNLEKASRLSSVFPAVQISEGSQLAPDTTEKLVAAAIQASEDLQKHKRMNHFLTRMNEEYFQPVGLHALMIQHRKASKPLSVQVDMSQDATWYDGIVPRDHTGKDRGLALQLGGVHLAGSGQHPYEAAPLIFPHLDEKLANGGPQKLRGSDGNTKHFLVDYIDRRAQMPYRAQNLSNLESLRRTLQRSGPDALPSDEYVTPRQQRRQQREQHRMESRLRLQTRRDERDVRRADRRAQRHGDDLLLQHQSQQSGNQIGVDGLFAPYASRHERRAHRQFGYQVEDDRRNKHLLGQNRFDLHRSGSRSQGRRGPISGLVGLAVSTFGEQRSRSSEPPAPDPHVPAVSFSGYEVAHGTKRANEHYDKDPAVQGPVGRRDIPGRRTRRGPQGDKANGPVRRVLRPDVLYLMIVNMPSDEELAKAMAG